MKQNEEIEQKKIEDSKRLRSNKSSAASSLAMSQSQFDKRGGSIISKLEEDDDQKDLQTQLAIGENCIDLKVLKLSSELLDEINQFIESLWLA